MLSVTVSRHCAHPDARKRNFGPRKNVVHSEMRVHTRRAPTQRHRQPLYRAPATDSDTREPTATHVFVTFLIDVLVFCKWGNNIILFEAAQCPLIKQCPLTVHTTISTCAVEHSLRAKLGGKQMTGRDTSKGRGRGNSRLPDWRALRRRERAGRYPRLQPCPCSRACRASRKARSSSNCHVSPPGRQG